MWPLLLLGLVGFLHVVGNKRRSLAGMRPITDTSQLRLGAIARLRPYIINRRPIPTRLYNDALCEAYERGDVRAIAALMKRGSIAPQAQSTPDIQTSGETVMVIGRNSPIDGVSNDEWGAFVDKLKTQTADYSTEKHIGAYHHHRERLTQLGIDPATLADETSQYQAIERDLSAYRNSERKLIDDYGGELIDIPGTNAANADGSNVHCVTMSGILGVVKAAGPKNARAWFKNAKDRADHPKTTEMFLRTNGLF